MNANTSQQDMHLQVTEGLTVAITPSQTHQFIMTTTEVAHGYDCETITVRQALRRNPEEFIEGKHYLKGVTFCNTLALQNAQPHQTYWTKRGIVRLGFFLKCGNAKLFRDWAEDLILANLHGTAKNRVKLYSHEMPLYNLLKQYLVLGDIKAVAETLQLTPNHVSRVKLGIRRSKKVMEALVNKAKYNKDHDITMGYPKPYVQNLMETFNKNLLAT